MSFLLPQIATWEQWAALFDDVRAWRPVVDAICEREGIAYDTIEAPESNTNAVFILDRRVVLKIYSPFWEEFPFERRLMELLQALLDEASAASRTARRVVIHGDLNAEHLLIEERGGRWNVSALIDFGDARIGVPCYEWMPLWLGLCNRDVAVMHAFLDTYDPDLLADDALGRRVAAWTLLHDFGTDAIAELFDTSGATRPARSLEALQVLVWPDLWQA